jgi:hypothetical protein
MGARYNQKCSDLVAFVVECLLSPASRNHCVNDRMLRFAAISLLGVGAGERTDYRRILGTSADRRTRAGGAQSADCRDRVKSVLNAAAGSKRYPANSGWRLARG